MRTVNHAFTLIELLVVVSIIAIQQWPIRASSWAGARDAVRREENALVELWIGNGFVRTADGGRRPKTIREIPV